MAPPPLPPDLAQNGTRDWHNKPARRLVTGGLTACSFIIAEEVFDRVAFDGVSSTLVTYLTTEMQESNPTASVHVNQWVGTAFLTAILGGFVADEFLGRFKTIVVFTSAYLIGLTLLTINVSLDKLKPCTSCHPPGSGAHPALFFFAIYLAAVGSGGSKPCASAFGADQFDESDRKERDRKSSFFNWWYFAQSAANVVSVTAVVAIAQDVGWGWGYGIPTALLGLVFLLFLGGAPTYRYSIVTGSPLTQIARVFFAAFRNARVTLPVREDLLFEGKDVEFEKPGRRKLPHTQQFRFLDKAAVVANDNSEDITHNKETRLSSWKICSVTEVEEVKQIVRTIPIWLALIPFSIATAQIHSLFIRQGSSMHRKVGHSALVVPSASVAVFLTITLVLFLPLYDRVLVPLARKYSGNYRGISMLQRTGVGIFFAVVGMTVAALVERKRLKVAESSGLLLKPKVPLPISVFWLVPQYTIFGIAEGFTSIGRLEFFYDQAPDSMQSMGTAMYLSSVGVGNFLSSLLITIVNKATKNNASGRWIGSNLNKSHVDYFYWLLAAMCLVELGVFAVLAVRYRYKSGDVSLRVSSYEQETIEAP